MSNQNTTETTEAYTPPDCAVRITDLADMPLEELAKRVVGCKNCPVFMACETGQGGTGWTCPECRSTGVYVDAPPDAATLPRDCIGVDCGNHKFHTRQEAETIRCMLCTGQAMELVIIGADAKKVTHHLVLTEHSKVSLKVRQEAMQAGRVKWTKYHEEEAAAEKAKR